MCAQLEDPYLSRVPGVEVMQQLRAEDQACFAHLERLEAQANARGLSISRRTDPTVWSSAREHDSPSQPAPATQNGKDHRTKYAAVRGNALSAADLDFYDQRGYLYVPPDKEDPSGNLVAGWLQLITKVVQSISEAGTVPPLMHGVTDTYEVTVDGRRYRVPLTTEPQEGGASDPVVIKTIWETHRHLFRGIAGRLFRNPALTHKIEQILGGKVFLSQARANLQMPFHGNGFNWHSDFETWHNEDGLPKPRCLSAVLALDRMTSYNGPLMVIPGSHRYFVHTRQSHVFGPVCARTNGSTTGPCNRTDSAANFKSSLSNQVYGSPTREQISFLFQKAESLFGEGIVVSEMEKGGLLLFDCNLMHASVRNVSPLGRKTVFFIFNSEDNQFLDVPFANRWASMRPGFLSAKGERTQLQKDEW